LCERFGEAVGAPERLVGNDNGLLGLQLNISSMKRLGPIYSMFILSGDFVHVVGKTSWTDFFLWYLRLTQSSTRAMIPVVTMTLQNY
jgi:hypothetical protein